MTKPYRRTLLASVILISAVIFMFTILIGNKGFSAAGPEHCYSDTVSSNMPFKLPGEMTFAGEDVPLQNFDTWESLDRELLTSAFRHSSTILIIKKANRYLPVIEEILAENNIPDDLKYMVAAESEFSNVISPAGATGFWQIMKATGREAGMEINDEVDERYHLEKSTQFACDYLRKSFEKYGSWTLAAASYNGGRNGIDEQIRIQDQNDYYDLLLNEETARYIFRVVAYKLIISDPSEYGFTITRDELYPELEYFEVEVDTAVNNFAHFADYFGTNYKLLKLLNPWLRKPYLTNRQNRKYIIKIPAHGMRNNIGKKQTD
ncbi:MAG TPA: lytic transglycosylase domain-containing protein [Bacteroidales bacterium]|nr:lytic transglycosylase domain-containing protein [Bacteroidales bacterium]HPR72101.1 lytic transglycosylase domain-containing protein [Bacteroidales bacterium]